MVRAPVHRLHVHVGPRPARKALKEIRHQFGLQIAHQPRAHLGVHREGRAPAQVHGGNGERLIHRHHKVAGAQNAALVAERLIKRLAQRNAHVFHRVVLIHIEIAVALQLQIEGAVPRKQLQHVIEEANAGRDLVPALAFDRQLQAQCASPWCCAQWSRVRAPAALASLFSCFF